MVDNFKGSKTEICFTRKQICESTGWSYWQIRPHLEQLVEMEYLHLHTGKQGQRHSHSCAVHLLRNGAGIRYIQELLGHALPETTQIYTRVEITDLDRVFRQTHPRTRR